MTFAEQLKGQLDIVDVVGQYVRLKRSGTAHRYVGLCPFHSEKTPSFHVNGANQFYYCFGCQATGDLFKFVQDIETLTFAEALKSLAERYGIPIPQRQRDDDPESRTRAALLEMHEVAAAQFQQNLAAAGGAAARAYIAARGLTEEAVREFRLGLSDPSGQQLSTRLQRFGSELMELSGLVKRRETGGFYDTFRGRLMFPIHDETGKVIAFGGRALRDEDKPKYLNSPETRIYKKSAVLYNLHRAKTAARKNDRMILVEGYMDVIGLYSAGFQEVVASSGTALGNDQVRAIKRQVVQQQASAGQVILNFDPDAAGSRSAEKYVGHFVAEGLRVRVLELPGDLDPDEYIKEFGAGDYSHRLEHAPTYFHWLAERARGKFDMNSPEGRVDAFKSILAPIQMVSDHVERRAIATEMAEFLKVDREVVAAQLRPQRGMDHRATAAAPQSATAAIPPNELLLITCLMLSAEARDTIKHYVARAGVLHLLETRSIFEAVLELDRAGLEFSIDGVGTRIDPRLRRVIADLSFTNVAIEEEAAPEQALHCLRALERKAHDVRCADLRRQIKELEQQGQVQAALGLMTELDRMKMSAPGV